MYCLPIIEIKPIHNGSLLFLGKPHIHIVFLHSAVYVHTYVITTINEHNPNGNIASYYHSLSIVSIIIQHAYPKQYTYVHVHLPYIIMPKINYHLCTVLLHVLDDSKKLFILKKGNRDRK